MLSVGATALVLSSFCVSPAVAALSLGKLCPDDLVFASAVEASLLPVPLDHTIFEIVSFEPLDMLFGKERITSVALGLSLVASRA